MKFNRIIRSAAAVCITAGVMTAAGPADATINKRCGSWQRTWYGVAKPCVWESTASDRISGSVSWQHDGHFAPCAFVYAALVWRDQYSGAIIEIRNKFTCASGTKYIDQTFGSSYQGEYWVSSWTIDKNGTRSSVIAVSPMIHGH
jgi:hypothetical protein